MTSTVLEAPSIMPMKVSVIIPTFNRAHVLQRALDSVVTQSHAPGEILIIDDGSTDHTAELIEGRIRAEGKKSLIRYVQTENHGVSAARNLGISLARYPWLAFLDSDDCWYPQKLAMQCEFLRKKPHFKVVHGEETWIRRGAFVNQMKKHKKSGGRIFISCLERCLISPSAILLHRDVLRQVGTFREDFPVCEDYDLWLRITSRYEVGFIETPIVAKYGGHEDQLSQRYKAMDHWRILSMLSILDSSFIDDKERAAVHEMIKYKSRILHAGYRKHGRHTDAEALHQSLTAKGLDLSETKNNPFP